MNYSDATGYYEAEEHYENAHPDGGHRVSDNYEPEDEDFEPEDDDEIAGGEDEE